MKHFLVSSIVAVAMVIGSVGLTSAQQLPIQTKQCVTPAEQALKIKTGRC